ncbi:MAG: ATP-dependent DNA helicase RecG [Chloroflexota bacterium]
MTTPAIERLKKVLDLEEKQAWRNRAVVGGLQAMGDRWATDVNKEGGDQAIVSAILLLLKQYPGLEKGKRPSCVEEMRRVLGGDLSGLGAWQQTDLEIPDGDEVAATTKTPSTPPYTKTPKVASIPESVPASESPSVEELSSSQNDSPPATIPPAEATDTARKRVRKQKKEDASVKKASPHDLQASVDILHGVGKAFREQLSRLGIHQVIDCLWHLPSRYEDYSQLRPIADLEPGEQVTVVANLWDIRERKVGMNRQMVQGILGDASGTLHATWWNKYVARQLKTGTTLRFSGKVGLYMGQKTLDNPSFEDIDQEMIETGRLMPIYRVTEGLSNKRLRSLIKSVVDDYGGLMSDPLPRALLGEYNLLNLTDSLRAVHFPDDSEQLEKARHRLIFEEFFYIQLGVLLRRNNMQTAEASALDVGDERLAPFRQSLSFSLTNAQERVLDETLRDMARSVPMTRLVQGDVGSGKTAVAAAAMYVAATNGVQSALLAPTQILAEQHYRGISALLGTLTRPDGTALQLALLTGRVTGAERTQILEGLKSGAIDILVGTTAIIQDSVLFANLGFAVVDEQHRFGVEQRGALRRDKTRPHLLVMSATPIPRSLALTIYGDLDVSVIDEMPPGRTPVKTKWFLPPERERVYNFLRREISEGRQGFIVYPLVEESEKVDAGAAVEEYERLRTEIFPNQRLSLLHGRMSGAEKDEVMSAFAAGEYDILVSTTVIEVGIDVPNASLIIIEDADRFGLAQLHQLRGRVGRGKHVSYCALVSKAQGADAEERLVALQESNDGFVLAQKDLDMRGPGDFLGTRQSGLPDLRVAQLGDLETLTEARNAARELLSADPQLTRNQQLSRQVERFWRGHGDVN